MSTTFVEAASLLLREGLEAILVLAALAAYLTKIGAHSRLIALWAGAVAAIVASLAGAWVFERFYGGAHNDLLEGGIVLFAAALMFYVSGWLFVRQDPRAWQAYLKEQTDRAVGGRTIWAVALLAFLAVAREGAETILFVHALAKTSGGWTSALISGLAAAAVLLVVLFVVIRSTTARLPLRAVFLVTSVFLFAMGLKFVGEGLKEFQEQSLIPFDVAPGSALFEAIGLNPTWEALGAQAAILVVAVLGLVWMSWRKPVAAG